MDHNLCYDSCPCDLTNTTGFETTIDLAATFSKYVIKNSTKGGVKTFHNCSEPIKFKIGNDTGNTTAFSNYSDSLQLWTVFEENFNCTGWCQMTYANPDFNITTNTCMNSDRITPCNKTNFDGNPENTCVDKSDNRSACNKYIRPTKNIEKYLLTDVNKYVIS